jgi:hypothetical protein
MTQNKKKKKAIKQFKERGDRKIKIIILRSDIDEERINSSW